MLTTICTLLAIPVLYTVWKFIAYMAATDDDIIEVYTIIYNDSIGASMFIDCRGEIVELDDFEKSLSN